MPTRTSQETSKKAKATTSSGEVNALQRPLQPSEALAAVVGPEPLPRGEVVSKVSDDIKSHNLQNPENRREILADDKLKSVFGKDKVTMFEMNKHLAGIDLTACAIGLAAGCAWTGPSTAEVLVIRSHRGPRGIRDRLDEPRRPDAGVPPRSQGPWRSASFRPGAGACTRSRRQ